MQCKLLTIAVPAYNMEKYLSRCLNSILLDGQQDYLEVILINDGSKDNTLAIAREYEKKYPDILTVVDKPNGGWGTAINKAIGLASGRYFKILDSDDWFDSKALVEFIELLKKQSFIKDWECKDIEVLEYLLKIIISIKKGAQIKVEMEPRQ